MDDEIGINGENCYESDKEFQQWEDDGYEEVDDGNCKNELLKKQIINFKAYAI